MYRHPTHLLTALCCILLSHCIPVASQSQYTLNRNTRLASWSTWINPSNGEKHEASCRGPDPKFKDYVYSPHVYFQDAGGGIREALFQNGVWNNGNKGGIIVKAATNSPLAVTQWWEGDNAVVLLFYIDANILHEARYDTRSGWNQGRSLDASIQHDANKPGSMSVTMLGAEIFVVYQNPGRDDQTPATVNVCRYFWGSLHTCARQFESWSGALSGTSTAVMKDGTPVGRPQIYYQSFDYPYSIIEQQYTDAGWRQGTPISAAPPRTQMAVIRGAVNGSDWQSDDQAHFLINNDAIFNYLTWRPWGNDNGGHSCQAGWCPARSIAAVDTYTSGIAVTGCKREMRAYFITNGGTLGEAVAVGWGDTEKADYSINPPYWGVWWYAGNLDVLSGLGLG